MTSQNGAMLNTVAYGNRPENVEVPIIPSPPRAPTANDVRYPLGKRWLDSSTGNEYVLGSQTQSNGVLQSSWTLLGAGSGGALNTITAGDSVVVTPVGANINFIDSSNVVSTGSGADVTFDLGADISVTGSITAGTDITAVAGDIEATAGAINAGTTVTAGTGISSTTGNITADAGDIEATLGNVTAGAAVSATTTVTAGTDLISTAGNVLIQGAGRQLRVEGGAVTDFIGTGTLTNGVATILNTNIAATDRIFIQRTEANASTLLGVLTYAITASTNFVVTSLEPGTPADTEVNDQSSFVYFIVRQL